MRTKIECKEKKYFTKELNQNEEMDEKDVDQKLHWNNDFVDSHFIHSAAKHCRINRDFFVFILKESIKYFFDLFSYLCLNF